MKRPAIVFHGAVRGGQLHIKRKADFERMIRQMEGSEVELVLRKHYKVRSLSQNAYYWGVVVALLAEHCGYDDPEEMHHALRHRFLLIHNDPIETLHGKTSLQGARSTAKLTTAEFSEYMEQARRLAAEMGVVIPSPGEIE